MDVLYCLKHNAIHADLTPFTQPSLAVIHSKSKNQDMPVQKGGPYDGWPVFPGWAAWGAKLISLAPETPTWFSYTCYPRGLSCHVDDTCQSRGFSGGRGVTRRSFCLTTIDTHQKPRKESPGRVWISTDESWIMCALFVELSQISLDFKHNEKPTENNKRRADDDQGKKTL